MDFSTSTWLSAGWLQHVDNPYTLIAAIAGVAGSGFWLSITQNKKPSQAFLLTMYGLFTVAILAIVASVVAVSFLLSGVGARDEVAGSVSSSWLLVASYTAEPATSNQQPATLWSFAMNKAHAHEYHDETIGWVWLGELTAEGTLQSDSVNLTNPPQLEQIVTATRVVNLRNTPPEFSWWRFRYVLGDLIMTLHEGERLQVLNTHQVGGQLWAVVLVLPE